MTDGTTECGPARNSFWPGWQAVAAVLALYSGCLAIATYPAITRFATDVPSRFHDPLIHIWTLRWYRACLMEWRLPFFCPDIQYPAGAPLGYLPPLQFQTLLYLPLSLIINNDILIYNILWFAVILTSGLGVFLLSYWIMRDRWCAAFAGLLAMLSGPVMFNSTGSIENTTLVWIPLFLMGWIQFVERPSVWRLVLAIVLYLLMAGSAPYFGIMGAMPAILFTVIECCRNGRRGILPWWRCRLLWFGGFMAAIMIAMPLLFAGQVWAIWNGYPMARADSQFERFSASIWSYFIPYDRRFLLSKILPSFYTAEGVAFRDPSHLGVVTLGLLAYAAIKRVRFPRAGFWWSSFAAMVILSLGAYWTIGSYRIALPAYWIREYLLIFKPMRDIGRFNLLAAVCAAVVAGAGLKHLLLNVKLMRRRIAVAVLLMVVAVADLAFVPYGTVRVPPMPSFYTFLSAKHPGATLLEVPFPNINLNFTAMCSYWQSFHRCRTSCGYTATENARQEYLVRQTSPFAINRLRDPGFLSQPESEIVDLVRDVRYEDYLWLYLTAHDFDFVVVHKSPLAYSGDWYTLNETTSPAPYLGRLSAILEKAKIYEDSEAAIYDRRLLSPPERPVLLCGEGHRGRLVRQGRHTCAVGRTARFMVYNPTPSRELQLGLEASAYRRPRTVRLVHKGTELACWSLRPAASQSLVSPRFCLPEGLQELTLVSDSEEKPARPKYAPVEGDMAPFSLWVTGALLLEPHRDAQLATPEAPGTRVK